MKILIFFLSLFLFASSKADDNPISYKIFDKDGEEVDYSDIIDKAEDSEVILFGEYHNNSISHYLQFKLTKSIFEENNGKVIIGAEMFESDDQIIVNEYMQDQITEKYFSKEAKLWDNFTTDYKPIFDFAKENTINFIATNIPRRYAGYVARNGLDKLGILSNDAHSYIAPLPIKFDATLPGYASLMVPMAMHSKKEISADTSINKKMPMTHTSGMMKKPEITYIAEAQAVKDATMAYFILKNLKSDFIFLHLNGSYHSDNFEGIYWYLKKSNNSLNIMTISTVEQENVDELEEEYLNKADFIIVVDKDMTKTN